VHLPERLADPFELAGLQRVTDPSDLGSSTLAFLIFVGQVGGIGLTAQLGAEQWRQMLQHLLFAVIINMLPKGKALGAIKRLQQTGDLTGMHATQQLAHPLALVPMQRLDNGVQLGAGGLAVGVGHRQACSSSV